MDYSYDDIKALKERILELYNKSNIAHINLKARRKK